MFNIRKDIEVTTDAVNTVTASAGELKNVVNPTHDKTYKKKTYTNVQIKKLLEGYIPVSVGKWGDIPNKSHIRYFKKDGTFVRGGFVSSHWLNKEGKPFIHLENSFKKGKGYASWPVAHESVKQIYKKISRDSGIEMDTVRTKTTEMITHMNKIVEAMKSQKSRIDSLEKELARTQLFMKRLAKSMNTN